VRSFVPTGLLSGNQGDAHSSRVGDVETRSYPTTTSIQTQMREASTDVRSRMFSIEDHVEPFDVTWGLDNLSTSSKKLLATTQNEKDKKANLISDWRQSVRFERERRTRRVNRSGGLPGIGGDGAGVLGVTRRTLDGRVGTTTTTTKSRLIQHTHPTNRPSSRTSQTHIDKS
jgi:hypothetical protein